MSKKVLVTKEFHRKALAAIAFQEIHGEDETVDLLRQAWMSYMENCCSDDIMEDFAKYCQEYVDELS